MSNIDWQYLRPAMIVVLCALVFSSALIFLGHDYHSEMLDYHAMKSTDYSNAELQLETLREDEKIIEEYLDSFIAIAESGLFDEKHRVNWVDTVNVARSLMRLPLVKYQISPHQVHVADYLIDAGLVNVMSSRIKLDAGLLHEGDLVDLFAWMDKYAPGQIHLSKCDMKSVEKVFAYYRHGPNLNVHCELDWFSVIPLEQG